MNRAEMLEAALGLIVGRATLTVEEAKAIARNALDLDYPWSGEAQYNHPKDFAIAQEWMEEHAKADELVFVKGRPVIALYYEPVANHYQHARRLFREFAERLRRVFEEEWHG